MGVIVSDELGEAASINWHRITTANDYVATLLQVAQLTINDGDRMGRISNSPEKHNGIPAMP